MRIILIITCLVCASASGYTQIFRYADLAVEFTSPKLNTVVTSPSVISFTFQVVNNGPDTIFATDTIVYGPSHSFSGKTTRRKQVFKEIVAPGDSTYFSDTISINSRAYMKPFYLAFSEVPMSYGPDNGKLFLQNEFSEDREDNKSQVKLYHTGNLNSENPTHLYQKGKNVLIYPNPTFSHSVTIAHPNSCSAVKMFNGNGQLLSVTPISNIATRTTLSVSELAPGIYYVLVEHSTGLTRQKLIVQ